MAAADVARIEDFRGGREKRIRRALALYRIDKPRHDAARLIARAMAECGADWGTLGYRDDRAPDVLYPHVLVDAEAVPPDRRCDVPGPVYRAVVGPDRGLTWEVRFRSRGREIRAEGLDVYLGFLAGKLLGVGACARRPRSLPGHDPIAVLSAALAEYAWDGFATRACGRTPPVHHWVRDAVIPYLRSGARKLPARERGTYLDVVDGMAELEHLGAGLLALGNRLDHRGRFADAATIHGLAYEVAIARNDARLGIDAARWRGRALRKRSDWREALRSYEAASHVAEVERDWGRLSGAYLGIGVVHVLRGAMAKAELAYHESLRFASVAGDDLARAMAHHGLVTPTRVRGDLIGALETAWAAFAAYPEEEEKALMLVNVGTLFLELGDLGAAQDAYRAALIRTRHPDGVAAARLGLSFLAAMRGERADHDDWYAEAERLLAHCSNNVTVQALQYRGKGLSMLGDAHAAAPVLSEALTFAEERGLNRYLFEVEEELDRLIQAGSPDPAYAERSSHIRAGLRKRVRSNA